MRNQLKTTGLMPLEYSMILRKFRQVKVNAYGYEPTISNKERYRRWFVPYRVSDRNMAVYEFDLYFADSYEHYGTEYVRARDNKAAKILIKRLYPNIVKFQWDDNYL